jgi:hypothetical protein
VAVTDQGAPGNWDIASRNCCTILYFVVVGLKRRRWRSITVPQYVDNTQRCCVGDTILACELADMHTLATVPRSLSPPSLWSDVTYVQRASGHITNDSLISPALRLSVTTYFQGVGQTSGIQEGLAGGSTVHT